MNSLRIGQSHAQIIFTGVLQPHQVEIKKSSGPSLNHSDLEDPLFNKCAHGDITDRTWLQTGEKILHSHTCDGQFFLKVCLISTEQSSLISSMLLNQYPSCLSLFYNSLFASVQLWQILLICTLLSFLLINGKCF